MRPIKLFLIIFLLFSTNVHANSTETITEENIIEALEEKDQLQGVDQENMVVPAEEEFYEEVSMEEKLQLITEKALQYNIPPELLKAIALVESNITQFKDGQPLISYDGGIGIMQVTNTELEVDHERLLYDTEYNIEMGAKILKSKWELQFKGRIPIINDSDPLILENWYFAIMAYNGLSPRNDPAMNQVTYQDKVYHAIQEYSQIEVADFPSFDVEYDEKGTMLFPSKQVEWENCTTESTQMFNRGDQVYVMNSLDPDIYNFANLRTEPSLQTATSKKVAYYTELEIVSGPYIASANVFNHFVMYEVKGKNFNGYIASSNIRRISDEIVFKQWQHERTEDEKKKWTIQLNTAIDPMTISNRNVYIVDEKGNGVFSKLVYHEDNYTITIEPEAPFIVGEDYFLMIKDLRSPANKPLKENVKMPFTIV